MYLYNLTLQKATAISHAVYGHFSGTKQQEIVVSHGKILELFRSNSSNGKMYSVLSIEIFSLIRSMVVLKSAIEFKDYLVIGSDTGKLVILEYNVQLNTFDKVHQETYGKDGSRSSDLGNFLAADYKGRALMISAIENEKLIYKVDQHSTNFLSVSSFVSTPEPSTVYDVVGLHVGSKNPIFACLELNFVPNKDDDDDETLPQQTIIFYELNLENNQVTIKYKEYLEERANHLIAIPSGNDGPGGVIVFSPNYVMYSNIGQTLVQSSIPKRNDSNDSGHSIKRKTVFTVSLLYKSKFQWFVLAQTELGDLFKITLDTDHKGSVIAVKLKYFDTVSIASAMCILKSRHLFLASEFGNHLLYRIVSIEDDEDDDDEEFSGEDKIFFYEPHSLKNLELVDEITNFSPLVHCQIAYLKNENSPQLYIAYGQRTHSTICALRHGSCDTEYSLSELNDKPNSVWTIKEKADAVFHTYIILSLPESLSILYGDTEVTEIKNSEFLSNSNTLLCALIGYDLLIQVYPEGIRSIKSGKAINIRQDPDNKLITHCATNHQQLVIVLNNKFLVYFEMDGSDQLSECDQTKECTSDVLCLAVADVSDDKQKSKFLGIGFEDNIISIISLDTTDFWSRLCSCSLPDKPNSIVFIEKNKHSSDLFKNTLCLNVGLENGIFLSAVLDQESNHLTEVRKRCIGTKPVKLYKVCIRGIDIVVVVSNSSYISYYHQHRHYFTLLSNESFDYIAEYSSVLYPDSMIAVIGTAVKVLSLENVGSVFNQTAMPLQLTPRKLVLHPDTNYIIVIETDSYINSMKTKFSKKKKSKHSFSKKKQKKTKKNEKISTKREKEITAHSNEDLSEIKLSDEDHTQNKLNIWASVIQILDPFVGQTILTVPLDSADIALALCIVNFDGYSNDEFLLVSVGRTVLFHEVMTFGVIQSYKIQENGKKLEIFHETRVKEPPLTICSYKGGALIGVKNFLQLYDMGDRMLLKRCENKNFPNQIIGIYTFDKTIVIGDSQESFFFVHYDSIEICLTIFAHDITRRWVTTACLLDRYTVAGADKQGNIFILRLPSSVRDHVEDDPIGLKFLLDRCGIAGSLRKLENIANFHVGDTVLSLQKTTLIPGGSECIVYTTLSGTIGLLVPFTSREDIEFFRNFENCMRSLHRPLCGGDHLFYRSSYFAVRNVIDGDLCEQFYSLDDKKQKEIGQILSCTASKISERLENFRMSCAF